MVPNLMHHIPDIKIFFHQIKSILKKMELCIYSSLWSESFIKSQMITLE